MEYNPIGATLAQTGGLEDAVGGFAQGEMQKMFGMNEQETYDFYNKLAVAFGMSVMDVVAMMQDNAQGVIKLAAELGVNPPDGLERIQQEEQRVGLGVPEQPVASPTSPSEAYQTGAPRPYLAPPTSGGEEPPAMPVDTAIPPPEIGPPEGGTDVFSGTDRTGLPADVAPPAPVASEPITPGPVGDSRIDAIAKALLGVKAPPNPTVPPPNPATGGRYIQTTNPLDALQAIQGARGANTDAPRLVDQLR